MSLPTALELATSFGVDEDGRYEARFLDRNDGFSRANQLSTRFQHDDMASQVVLNEFGALYLPRFIRACLSAPAPVDLISWWTLKLLSKLPSFAMYLRSCSESESLFKEYTEKVLRVFPSSLAELCPYAPETSTKLVSLFCWSLTCLEIMLHVAYPTPNGDPPTPTQATLLLTSSTRADLGHKTGKLFYRLTPQTESANKQMLEDSYTACMKINHWATGVATVQELLAGEDRSGSTALPYVLCNGKRHGGCVEMKAGSVCGGCKSVRYCSREHQMDDWKEHKKFCIKPIWEE